LAAGAVGGRPDDPGATPEHAAGMAVSTARHLLRVSDLTAAEIGDLLDLAVAMDADPAGWVDALRGHSVACYFAKPSTRTRVSFAAAAARLGMTAIVLRPDELQLGRGETIADTGRTLSSYCDAIVIRTFAQADVDELAAAASVPVINALTDDHHPCQALADVLTVRQEFGRLEGIRLAYVGDGNNVANSLLEAGARTGLDVVVACPPGYEPAVAGEVVHEPREAVRGAHAVYTDVWVSMGDEAEQQARDAAFRPYQVDETLLGLARPDAIFLHCLPAHRGQEVTAEVIDGPRSRVWAQAHNRESTEEALLYRLVSSAMSAS